MNGSNADLARRYVEEVVSQGKLDVIDEIYAENYINHTNAPGVDVEGRDGVRDIVERWRSAFPDVSVTIHDVIESGDRVVTRINVTGTHDGDWRGVAATGNAIDIQILSIFRIEDGLIAERWENADMFGLLQQLGIA